MQLVTPGGNHCCLMANDVHTQTQTQKFFYSTLKIHNDLKKQTHVNLKNILVRETSVKINKIIAGKDATL